LLLAYVISFDNYHKLFIPCSKLASTKEMAWNLMRNSLKENKINLDNQELINFNPDLLPLTNHAVLDTLKTFTYANMKISEIVPNMNNNTEPDLDLVHLNCFENGLEIVADKVNILAEFCLKSKLGDSIDCTKQENISKLLLTGAQLRTKCYMQIGKRAVTKGWTDVRTEIDDLNWRCESFINQLDFDREGKSMTKND